MQVRSFEVEDMDPVIFQMPPPLFFGLHPSTAPTPAYQGPARPAARPACICPSMTLPLGLFLAIRSEQSLGPVKGHSTDSCSGHTLTTIYQNCLPNLSLRVYRQSITHVYGNAPAPG